MMGICGTAMASLAGILKGMGHSVRGSDQNIYPPMSTQLQQLGIPLLEGYRPENLKPRPDLVIVGNVISASNAEAQALLASDIPYVSLPQALGEYVIGSKHSLVIAGTHGKTTTTSLAAFVADGQGIAAGFLVGGIPINYGVSFQIPVGPWFIIEGDEYDTAFFDKVPKFVHYRPRHVILTSVEFDHADIYRDLAHVKEAFKKLLALIPSDGTLVYHAADVNIRDILSVCRCQNIVSYGETQGDYQIVDRQNLHGRNQFSIVHRGERIADVAIKQFGLHNTLNTLAVFAMAQQLGWRLSNTLQSMADFKGVKRRQEFLFEQSGIKVIEDFAHHPTAVQLTLKSVREQFPKARVVAVFEPRSATSRRKIFQAEYAEALSHADLVFLAKPYDTTKINEAERFSSEQLAESLEQQGVKAFVGQSTQDLVQLICQHARTQDVILVMSNGGFDGIYSKLKGAL
jgi:UDP-N-acetylmuramate: L-alanyl-gamma-D-glutamyl-meso-diaminopimelate ligase